MVNLCSDHLLSPSFPFLTAALDVVLAAVAFIGDFAFFPVPMKWLNSSVCFSRKSNLTSPC